MREERKANFVWTQLKINSLFEGENISDYGRLADRFDKVEEGNNAENATEAGLLMKKGKVQQQQKPLQKAGYYKAPLTTSP